jgi:ATP-dependent RNA helicase SUPV3L1/SUV3
LVTVPAAVDGPRGYDTMSGYRVAGDRMIRVDMLERLADQLRVEDSRGGFEAKADMLSITGMTLQQFADLMTGLGYGADRGERPKERPLPVVGDEVNTVPVAETAAAASEAPETSSEAGQPTDVPEITADKNGKTATAVAAAPETPPGADQPSDVPEETAGESARTDEVAAQDVVADGAIELAEPDTPELEVFYTFTWAPRRRSGPPRQARSGEKPRKSKSKPKVKKGEPPSNAREYAARPPQKDKIDPDNPFAAALMGLKDNS